ncbi:MAG TPA: leucyl aminopeptidase [Anaerolineales bacterium]|nr:leucyl aminopeptidase [Anaerolineales bacterium]
MQVIARQGLIQEIEADAIIVNLFEGVETPGGATGAVDRALDGAISELIAGGDLRGKLGEVAVLYPRQAPARRVLVVGLGPAAGFDLEAVRRAAATAIKRARELNARKVATIVHGTGTGGLELAAAAQAVVEGSLMALHRYERGPQHVNQVPDLDREIERLTIVEADEAKLPALEEAVRAGEYVVNGVLLARNLVNMPPNQATPTRLAAVAEDISERYDMRLTIGDRAWAAERHMGAFLAVAKGAGEEPKFIVLEHNAGREDLATIVLVGKGITFDSGGVSLKPVEGMSKMKNDMAGAAAVLGAMEVVGKLKLPLHVVAITPATENMPDADAYRPADVITASNGVTIEIISTDAEGRMILADALVYAQQYKPQAVVDLATLTGACVIALGKDMAGGLFCNHDQLRDRLLASAGATAERLWPMPLWDDYLKPLKSKVADMRNAGGRYDGVGTSAIFLKQFTDYPWAHLDIAGMASLELENWYLNKDIYRQLGGTGFGVRLLVDFLRRWAEEA